MNTRVGHYSRLRMQADDWWDYKRMLATEKRKQRLPKRSVARIVVRNIEIALSEYPDKDFSIC